MTASNGLVNVLDQSVVKSQLFAPLSTANLRADIDTSGIVNILDQGVVKANLFTTATCP